MAAVKPKRKNKATNPKTKRGRAIAKRRASNSKERANALAGHIRDVKRGRPAEYKPEFCIIAEEMCKLGATDQQLADFFGIERNTIYSWQNKYPDFSCALKDGKGIANNRVERSLYHKAVGYEFDEEMAFMYKGEIIPHTVRKHVPPSDTSMIFWLKNRKGDEWRDKRDVNHAHGHFDLGNPDMSITDAQDMFRQLRNMTAEQLREQFKVIEGQVVPTAPSAQVAAEVVAEDADEGEDT